MGRVVHFEIQVDDLKRAEKFYADVFGWTFEDWTEFAGMRYSGAITGVDSEPGINGALMQRQGASPERNQPLNGFACTIEVENYDAAEEKILANGGAVALPKYALAGMAWQGYYHDTEGNLFGVHQPDENAK